MSDAPIIYADGYTCIDVTNGIVRLPMFAKVRLDDLTGHENRIVAVLAVPLSSFFGMYRGMEEMVQLLKDRGAIFPEVDARAN